MKLYQKIVLAILVCCLPILQGCSKTSPSSNVTKIKVAFWGGPEEIDIITNSISEWRTQHPEIDVVFEHTPYSGYDSKMLTRIAGGAAPDIIATEVDYFVTFASKGVLEDLTPFLNAEGPNFPREAFFSTIMDRFTVDGKILAIPRDVAPFACVFYNKKLFDEAGLSYPQDDWTWDDMLGAARALTKKDASGRIVQYGFYGWAWQNFIYGNGGALVDNVKKPTKTLLDDPKSIQGLQFYADLINLYKVMPTPVALANLGMGVDLMFASGRLAMFLSGIWETPGLRNYKFDWDVALFPKNPQGIRAFGSGGSGYAILQTSKHKKEAWEVVKALTGKKGQEQLAKRGLAQPALREVSESDIWVKDPLPPANKKMLNEAVNDIVFSPFHPRWREVQEKFLIPKLDLIFNGKKTAAEVIKEVTLEINAVLQSKDSQILK
ncbi:MAG: sugar ABC transporter substrate-binding protein [Candidatus Omnitrophica bacterium]|nr:sugar ABC transporter substrate-binding protein [Candidatus Omnitrophota bacterium]MDD5670325.1 sugar ABC transporter substrate-binding protein [Candidatus Omnitrophota bacterium]